MNQSYNTEVYFNAAQYSKLLRYKRIIEARLLNPEYPSTCISSQDIITQVTLILNK